jgi:chromosome segregation ATPase
MIKTVSQMTTMQTRLTDLENNVACGDEKIVKLLNAQLQMLREIKDRQSKTFHERETSAMREKNEKDEIQNQLSDNKKDVL